MIAVSRGLAKPYLPHAAWAKVTPKIMDRLALEKTGQFGPALAALKADIVIDLICFTEDSARQLVAVLQGKVSHLIHIGTIWTHGFSTVVPTPEHAPKFPFGDYGIQKKSIENFLLAAAYRNGLPATLIHLGQIVGQGWVATQSGWSLQSCGV